MPQTRAINTPYALASHQRLGITLLLALLLHGGLLFIDIDKTKPPVLTHKTLTVTLVTPASVKLHRTLPVTPYPIPTAKPIVQPSQKIKAPLPTIPPLPKQRPIVPNLKPYKPIKEQPITHSVTTLPERPTIAPHKKHITTTAAQLSLPKANTPVISAVSTKQPLLAKAVKKSAPPETVKSAPPPLILSADALRMQIVQVGAKIGQQAVQAQQAAPKAKLLGEVKNNKYIAQQYVTDVSNKIERIGNMNYPESARKRNVTGRLMLDIGIKPSGALYKVRIVKSSGYTELDQAAQKIVRMSAPFPPLPKALLTELNVLVITRVLNFSDESGLVTQ